MKNTSSSTNNSTTNRTTRKENTSDRSSNSTFSSTFKIFCNSIFSSSFICKSSPSIIQPFHCIFKGKLFRCVFFRSFFIFVFRLMNAASFCFIGINLSVSSTNRRTISEFLKRTMPCRFSSIIKIHNVISSYELNGFSDIKSYWIDIVSRNGNRPTRIIGHLIQFCGDKSRIIKITILNDRIVTLKKSLWIFIFLGALPFRQSSTKIISSNISLAIFEIS